MAGKQHSWRASFLLRGKCSCNAELPFVRKKIRMKIQTSYDSFMPQILQRVSSGERFPYYQTVIPEALRSAMVVKNTMEGDNAT